MIDIAIGAIDITTAGYFKKNGINFHGKKLTSAVVAVMSTVISVQAVLFFEINLSN